MKEAVKKDLKEKHDLTMLKEVIRSMQTIENVDFESEIERIRQKIKVLFEVKSAIDNELHMKQSIELLEALYTRVCDLEDPTKNGNKFAHLLYIEYPISINWETKLMLQSRVEAAKKFKQDFYDLLHTTY